MTGRRAILIVPPAPDMIAVEGLRRRFDPLVQMIPAHVTLVFPFATEISDDDLKRHLTTAMQGHRSFSFDLDGFSCTTDHVLFFNIGRGADHVRELHNRLYTGPLGEFLSAQEFVPHVTVGRFATTSGCDEAHKVVRGANLRVRTVASAIRVYGLDVEPYVVQIEVRWP